MDAKKTSLQPNSTQAGRTNKTPHRPAYIREIKKQREKRTEVSNSTKQNNQTEAVQIEPTRVGFGELKRRASELQISTKKEYKK